MVKLLLTLKHAINVNSQKGLLWMMHGLRFQFLSFPSLENGLLMSFHGNSLLLFNFFEQLWWCPPGIWCPMQAVYSAYRVCVILEVTSASSQSQAQSSHTWAVCPQVTPRFLTTDPSQKVLARGLMRSCWPWEGNTCELLPLLPPFL